MVSLAKQHLPSMNHIHYYTYTQSVILQSNTNTYQFQVAHDTLLHQTIYQLHMHIILYQLYTYNFLLYQLHVKLMLRPKSCV